MASGPFSYMYSSINSLVSNSKFTAAMNRIPKLPGLLTLVIASWALSARAVFPDHPTNDFKSVGEIGPGSGDRAFNPKGCGVAISPHWVISVAHVGGNEFYQEGHYYQIQKKIFYKTSQGEPADLALFYIPETIKYYSPILFAPFDSGPNALKNQTVSLVGYGETCRLRADSKGWQPVKNTAGVKRIATNTIDKEITDRYNLGTDVNPKWHSSETLVYDIDQPGNPKVSTLGNKITKNEGGVADKDSGGGWFLNVGGQQKLVALSATVGRVTNLKMDSPYCYGGLGFGIYLTPYRDWIHEQTGL